MFAHLLYKKYTQVLLVTFHVLVFSRFKYTLLKIKELFAFIAAIGRGKSKEIRGTFTSSFDIRTTLK